MNNYTEKFKLRNRVCNIASFSFIFICLSFNSIYAAERNYDSEKGVGIVWRANPTVVVPFLGEQKPYDFKELHGKLKEQTEEDRKALDGPVVRRV